MPHNNDIMTSTNNGPVSLNVVIALGAMAAARHIRECDAAIDADGTPQWMADPTDEDWSELDQRFPHSHEYDVDIDIAYLDSYVAVSHAALDAINEHKE